MRVCHISTVHNLFDTRIFYKECLSLEKQGFEVYFIVQHDRLEKIKEVNIIPLKKTKSRFVRFFYTNFNAFLKAYKLKASIYHFHDIEFIFWAYLLKRLTGSKVIYDVHEDYSSLILNKKWIPNKFLRILISKLITIFELFFSKKMDGVILAEDCYFDKFKGKNKNLIKILNYPIINNGIKNNIYKDEEELNLVYTGTISEDRGIWNILNAFVLLVNKTYRINLFLIGKFYDFKLYKKVLKFIIDNDINNSVKIIGGNEYVKREVIDSYYNYMNIGLALIPYNKNFENKILTKIFEYMKFGIPVIATDFPIWKEFFEKNRCGFVVNPNNYSEIAEKIIYLFNNKDLRNEMGNIGRKLIFERYNWNLEEKKLIELYEVLIRK